MNKRRKSEGGWFEATVGAVVLGTVFGIGTACIVIFHSFWSAAPIEWLRDWSWYFGALVGIAVTVSMLWLFHRRQVTAWSIKRSIGKLIDRFGTETS